MVWIYLEDGGDWIIRFNGNPADAEVQYGLQYRSVVGSVPESRSMYKHLENVFDACELRDLAVLRQVCRGLVVEYFCMHSIFY